MQESSPENLNTPWWIWALTGCGCLGFGLIVIGIVSAIALPSFLNQANKARESEAKTYVTAYLRSQQAHYVEFESFATSFDQLTNNTLPAETMNYRYQIKPLGDATKSIAVVANPIDREIKSYVGVVFAVPGQNPAGSTIIGVCESVLAGISTDGMPELYTDTQEIICPPSFSLVPSPE